MWVETFNGDINLAWFVKGNFLPYESVVPRTKFHGVMRWQYAIVDEVIHGARDDGEFIRISTVNKISPVITVDK